MNEKLGLSDVHITQSYVPGCIELLINHLSRGEPDLFINGCEVDGTAARLLCSKDNYDGFISLSFKDLPPIVLGLFDSALHYSLRNKDQQQILFVPFPSDEQMASVGQIIATAEIKDAGI